MCKQAVGACVNENVTVPLCSPIVIATKHLKHGCNNGVGPFGQMPLKSQST